MTKFVNNCVFVVTSGGAGAFTVSGAATGYQTPAAAGTTDGSTYRYRAQSNDLSEWEIGTTTASSSSTSFSRSVLASSNGGTAVNFSAPPTVMLTVFAADLSVDAGTLMLFQQTSAPTGWTKQTTHNDKALRVVSGTASSGGTNAFSTVMAQTTVGNTTLDTTTMAAHTHGFKGDGGYAGPGITQSTYASNTAVFTTYSSGSGNAHNHPITLAIQYVDIIIASKD